LFFKGRCGSRYDFLHFFKRTQVGWGALLDRVGGGGSLLISTKLHGNCRNKKREKRTTDLTSAHTVPDGPLGGGGRKITTGI